MDDVTPVPSDDLMGARRSFAPTSDLDARLAHLSAAVDALQQRTPGTTVDDADAVITRASARLRLSADHTVVALAGATGSGKSSTFNALTGLDVAAVGVRRPTTSWAMACLWGSAGAADLLEWLGIPQRHQVVRDSLLDTKGESGELQGMVLLDLPDHDSTEVAHRLEVDRLVYLADVIVWVMDPQKYADAAIHDRLLRPNVQHAAVMVAVVNHMDEVPEDGRERLYRDARRLLDDDGLSSVPLIATSARVGTGLEELRSVLASRIADKAASRTRISADVDVAAQRLIAELGATPSSASLPGLRDRLVAALASSAAGEALPEAARNVVRTEVRDFTAGATPEIASSITAKAVAEVDELVAGLHAPSTPHVAPSASGGGAPGWLKILLFLVFLAGGGWLAAALAKDVPNVIAAAAVTGAGLLLWLISLVVGRGSPEPKPSRRDPSAGVGAAVDRTVVAAVRTEVEIYEKVASDLRSALSH